MEEHDLQRRHCLGAMLGLALAGCSGGGNDDEQAPAIGPDGGTVQGPAGSRVDVPAGALAAPTPLAVAASNNGAPALPGNLLAQGSMYALTPHGTQFAKSALLTLPFDAAGAPPGLLPTLYKTNPSGGWDAVPGATLQGNAVSASIDGFSWVVLVFLPPIIVSQPADAAVAETATATFTVVVPAGSYSYAWQRSDDAGATWSPLAGATLASYTTPATVAADDGALFRVTISSAAGTSISRSALLSVSSALQSGGLRIGAGGGFSIAALASGEVVSWGQAGDDLGGATEPGNRLTPGPVLMATQVVAVATGTAHALALTSGGEVWAWGYNGFGQLCNLTFDRAPRGLPFKCNGVSNVVAIAAGSGHSVFLRADGTVWTVGRNHRGQLGHGNLTDSNGASPVAGLSGVTAVAAGGDHTLALKSDGTVWAWGDNGNGQLGDGSSVDRSSPVQVAGLNEVTRIAAGSQFSLALVREQPANAFGVLWGWGLNDRGQLGTTASPTPLTTARLTLRAPLAEIAAGTMHTVLIYFDGVVFTLGDNQRGQLGDPGFAGAYSDTPRYLASVPSHAVAASAGAGFGHTLVQFQDGSVWAWGDNQTGQTGSGTEGVPQPLPAAVTGLNLN